MDFFEFAGAWFFGIFTNVMTNDSTAIIQCRHDLLDLEKELEDLRRDRCNESCAGNNIKSIKVIIKRLDVNHAGLFMKNSELQSIIDQSLKLFNRWEEEPSEPQNLTAFIGVELGELWGDNHKRIYETTKIKKLRHFFHAGFLKRLRMELWVRFINCLINFGLKARLMKNVITKYIMGIGVVFLLSILAYGITKFIGMSFGEGGITIIRRFCIFFSTFLTAVALFGLSGWERQTWGGNSKPERLNSWLYKFTSGAAYLFAVVSFFI